MRYAKCEGCPIRNVDYEEGSSCNLGYTIRAIHEPEDWVDASPNCGLEVIKHRDGEFRPEWFEHEEKEPDRTGRPPLWPGIDAVNDAIARRAEIARRFPDSRFGLKREGE